MRIILENLGQQGCKIFVGVVQNLGAPLHSNSESRECARAHGLSCETLALLGPPVENGGFQSHHQFRKTTSKKGNFGPTDTSAKPCGAPTFRDPPRDPLRRTTSHCYWVVVCVLLLILLAMTYFGHDLVWPRPCLATTLFGTRPYLATAKPTLATSLPDLGNNLKLAELDHGLVDFWWPTRFCKPRQFRPTDPPFRPCRPPLPPPPLPCRRRPSPAAAAPPLPPPPLPCRRRPSPAAAAPPLPPPPLPCRRRPLPCRPPLPPFLPPSLPLFVGQPKISLFFFSSPAAKFFFSSLSWCFLVEFWWCFEHHYPQMCTFGILGLSCASPWRPPSPLGPPNPSPHTSPALLTLKNTYN